jgi:uncharacterized protein YecT (DUF1311 family)
MLNQLRVFLCFVLFLASAGILSDVSAQSSTDKKPSPDLIGSTDQIYGTQAAFTVCMSSAGGDYSKMQSCLDVELADQKKRLTNVTKQLNQKLSKNERGQLALMMRSWHNFKKSNCRFTGMVTGDGTIGSLMMNDCDRQMYTQKAKELEDIYQGVVLTH